MENPLSNLQMTLDSWNVTINLIAFILRQVFFYVKVYRIHLSKNKTFSSMTGSLKLYKWDYSLNHKYCFSIASSHQWQQRVLYCGAALQMRKEAAEC